MPAPSPSWNLVRVYGTWRNLDGTPKKGVYKVSIPVKITNATDDSVISAGTFSTGTLAGDAGQPSIDVMVPATDDPDVQQTGWLVTVEVTFADRSKTERFRIEVPYADRPAADGGTGNGVNLRGVVSPDTIPVKDVLFKVGIPGGIALLDSNGNALNADGSAAFLQAVDAASSAATSALSASAAATSASSAATSAASARDAAQTAATAASATTDVQMAGRVSDAASATRAALDSAYVSAAKLRGNRFVALGDSISTAADVAAGGAGYGAAWPHMSCALSMQRLNFAGNAGVTGNNTAQMLARVASVLALNPSVVTVMGGTNDLTQAVTFSTWSSNIKAIAAQLRAAGIRVVLCTIPPRGNTTYLATQTTWNTWLRQFAADNRYDLLDFFTVLVDPATGMFKSGYDSGDGLHPSQDGHIAMASYVSAQLTTSAFAPIAARCAVDGANLLANPLLTSGSPNPTSWINTGVASADFTEGLVTDSDFDGKAWQIAYTSAASASNFRQFQSFSVSTGSGFSVGDTLLFTARVKVTTSSGVNPGPTAGLRFRLETNGGSTLSYTPVQAIAKTHPVALLWFVTTVPSGTTSIQLDTIVGTIPVGSSFAARVGNFGVYNLSTLASTAP